jgi:hypothetical protein
VTVVLDNGERLNGTVREKTRFPELLRQDGSVERKAFARYFVSITNRPDAEALVDHEHIVRDRKALTKQMLRSYLKNSLHREAWAGAPWQVKERIANEYRISTKIPPHLTYEYQVAQRKANHSMKKEQDGQMVNYFPQSGKLPELKPKGSKKQISADEVAKARQEQFLIYQRALANNPNFSGFGQPIPAVNDPQFFQMINQHPGFPPLASRGPPKPFPAPPTKGPIEDLEVEPAPDAKPRPPLKYLSQDTPNANRPSEGAGSGISMESVGLLLETWNTLNVFCEVFLLDSFTFDDYVEALQFTSEEVQSELVVEIHCAVLKRLVHAENDKNGQVQISLPIAAQDESDETSTTGSSSAAPSPTPEPETTRTTRGSLAKTEAEQLRAQAIIDAKLHRGAEIDQCVRGYGWRSRLRKRDFANNRWVVIVVGLLNLFTLTPRLKETCEKILIHLAPLNMDASEETAISQYSRLNINLRVEIIQFLCTLSIETPAVRTYMEECTLAMTRYRKEKIEYQRSRKAS